MGLLFGLAVLPAFLLMLYIRKMDKIEKEPKSLIVSLFALGALSTVSAVIIGLLAEEVVKQFVDEESVLYAFINAFFMVALVEEGGKFVMLKLRTWHNREFNYTFDAVVYSVSVSMGFATLENILYVLPGGLGTAVLRGLLSVPGHAINAVFMGYFYGLAKRSEYLEDKSSKNKNLAKALFSATLIHGFYDFCLMSGIDALLGAFLLFEVAITVIAIRKVNKLSREDSPLGPPMGVAFNNYGGYFEQNTYYYDPNGYYSTYNNSYNPYGSYQQQSYNSYYQQNQGYQGQQYYDPYSRYNGYQNNGYAQGQYSNGYYNNNSYNGYGNTGYSGYYNNNGTYNTGSYNSYNTNSNQSYQNTGYNSNYSGSGNNSNYSYSGQQSGYSGYYYNYSQNGQNNNQ